MKKRFIGIFFIVALITILIIAGRNFMVPTYTKKQFDNAIPPSQINTVNKDNYENYIINIQQGAANRTIRTV